MARFLIEIPHAEERRACAQAIRVFLESGPHYLTQAEWGCGDNEHFGWMIVDCPTREDARRIVPPAFRADARVVRLRHFTLEEIDKILAEHPAT